MISGEVTTTCYTIISTPGTTQPMDNFTIPASTPTWHTTTTTPESMNKNCNILIEFERPKTISFILAIPPTTPPTTHKPTTPKPTIPITIEPTTTKPTTPEPTTPEPTTTEPTTTEPTTTEPSTTEPTTTEPTTPEPTTPEPTTLAQTTPTTPEPTTSEPTTPATTTTVPTTPETTTTEPTTPKPTTMPSCEPYEHPNFDPLRNCSIATKEDIKTFCTPNTPFFWDKEHLSEKSSNEDFNTIMGHAYKYTISWPEPGPDCWGYKRCMKFCPEIYPDQIHVCIFDCPCRNGNPMQFDEFRAGCVPKANSAICDNTLVHSHCDKIPIWST